MNPNIRHRLLNFSETPPASAWPRIADTLDTPAYAQKLHHFEGTPPAGTWEAIQKELNGTGAKVVPLRVKLFKYAIAAAVLLAVAAGSIFYLTNSTGAELARQPQHVLTNSDTNNKDAAPTQAEIEAAALPNNESAAIKTDRDVSSGIATISDRALVRFSPRARLPKKGIVTRPITLTPDEKVAIDIEQPNRYMIATTETGKVVRLPKKAYSDYACAETLQNYWCKERLASIQSKMAASVATDFTGFIDLLKKLQEPQ